MKTVVMQLADLKRPEKNIRLHTDKQLKEFRRSIEMFGQIRPIVLDEDHVILAGNGLYETLLMMERTEADCIIMSGLTEKEKKKLMLADNRIFDLGVDDMAAFDSFIFDLKDDLDIPGFDEDMLQSLVMNAKEADELLSDYGLISDERAGEMKETHARYEERDAAAAQASEVREAMGQSEAYKSEEGSRTYILCPECGVKIWQ